MKSHEEIVRTYFKYVTQTNFDKAKDFMVILVKNNVKYYLLFVLFLGETAFSVFKQCLAEAII